MHRDFAIFYRDFLTALIMTYTGHMQFLMVDYNGHFVVYKISYITCNDE